MDEQTKELVAIGASVAANCYPCMKHHLAKCEDLGVAAAEIRAAAKVGMMVNRGAASNTRKFVAELLGVEDPALADRPARPPDWPVSRRGTEDER